MLILRVPTLNFGVVTVGKVGYELKASLNVTMDRNHQLVLRKIWRIRSTTDPKKSKKQSEVLNGTGRSEAQERNHGLAVMTDLVFLRGLTSFRKEVRRLPRALDRFGRRLRGLDAEQEQAVRPVSRIS